MTNVVTDVDAQFEHDMLVACAEVECLVERPRPAMQVFVFEPAKRKKHLIFDTEYEAKRGTRVGEKWCNDIILQISWVVVDVHDASDSGSFFDYYIRRPELESSYVHRTTGISKKTLDAHGVPLTVVLDEFMKHVRDSERIVGFNCNTDIHHVYNELLRTGRLADAQFFRNFRSFCLMKNTKDIVRAVNVNGEVKLPKLTELYAFYFNNATFANAHNARADVEATLACYREYMRRECAVRSPVLCSALPDPMLGADDYLVASGSFV